MGGSILFSSSLLLACQMPNPAFQNEGTDDESTGMDTIAGDGDGGSNSESGDGQAGDGDGEPGDGDGDPGDGDGDGQPGDGDGAPADCNGNGMLWCDGMCIDPGLDPTNCGFCGNDCGDQLCALGSCAPKRYVFATEQTYSGDLGGVEQATEICESAAMAAMLSGSFRPWLSDVQLYPAAAIEAGPAVYVLPQGQVVALSGLQLLSGQLLHAIDQTENGDAITPTPACDGAVEFGVWTGTNAMGETAEPHCDSWTGSDNALYGRIGDATATDATWSVMCEESCDVQLRIYCVAQ